MTFNTLCNQFKCTQEERVSAAHFLASFRYRKTLEACLASEKTRKVKR